MSIKFDVGAWDSSGDGARGDVGPMRYAVYQDNKAIALFSYALDAEDLLKILEEKYTGKMAARLAALR